MTTQAIGGTGGNPPVVEQSCNPTEQSGNSHRGAPNSERR